MKKFCFLFCFLFLFGCEKKATLTTDSKTAFETNDTNIISESISNRKSPIESDTSKANSADGSYDSEKIYDGYFSSGNENVTFESIVDQELSHKFLIAHEQFESEWRHWLYDGDTLGTILLNEKNLESQENRLGIVIEKMQAGARRWKELLKYTKEVCNAQASSVSCK